MVRILTVRSGDDRSTPARIRDAALARFAADGFQRATLRAIAADAGVSPALVLHHFGSKDGLRQACDDHVVRLMMAEMEPWISRPSQLADQPASFAQMFADAGDLVGYVGRALVEGGTRTDDLVDRFFDLTEEMLAEGEARGTIRASGDRRALAAVVVVWDLATIVLGAHLARAIGESDPQRIMLRYATVAMEVFSRGMIIEPHERQPK